MAPVRRRLEPFFFAPHVVAASEPKAISIFGKSAAFGVRSQNLACDHKLVGSGG